MAGGMIDRQGLLHVGDVIKEINGKNRGNRESISDRTSTICYHSSTPILERSSLPFQVSQYLLRCSFRAWYNAPMVPSLSKSFPLVMTK